MGIAGMTAPARAHTEIFSADGAEKIGEVTSGGFGPTYGKPLAMGYVKSGFDKEVSGMWHVAFSFSLQS